MGKPNEYCWWFFKVGDEWLEESEVLEEYGISGLEEKLGSVPSVKVCLEVDGLGAITWRKAKNLIKELFCRGD